MPRKILAFLSLIALFIIIAIGTQFKPQILRIKKIECRISSQDCPPELIQKLESLKEKSFLLSPLETHILSLDLNLYQLESISKLWPTTVNLKFSYKPSSYIIKTKQDMFLVTENGLVQAVTTEQKLPTIEIDSWTNPIQEDLVEKQLHKLNLNLIQSLAVQKISYKNIKIKSSQEIEIQLKENLVALAQKEELENQIIKLAIILGELDLNAIDLQINTIDLRFNFPLLKTASTTQS
ncbi:MAG: hypothetical protein HN846_02220 [Candidatus Pacebacteria bacterium]|nr:hypothetical protein [Candidatus Paceibacterota bacterium]MBT7309514.1 hypothetical protein [Candidatus Paceibacterota bacterium]